MKKAIFSTIANTFHAISSNGSLSKIEFDDALGEREGREEIALFLRSFILRVHFFRGGE